MLRRLSNPAFPVRYDSPNSHKFLTFPGVVAFSRSRVVRVSLSELTSTFLELGVL